MQVQDGINAKPILTSHAVFRCTGGQEHCSANSEMVLLAQEAVNQPCLRVMCRFGLVIVAPNTQLLMSVIVFSPRLD